MASIRSVICSVLGHVDHGKSSILDTIRGTAIVQSEAGAITQNIGASFIPIATVQKICGNLLEAMGKDFSVPGLLFIDTPGHAAFSNLRKRGGNLADIAILVVDINEGFKPQTFEALTILAQYKTPFIVVANKVDLLPGWQRKNKFLLANVAEQELPVQRSFEQKMYELVGKLAEKEFKAERFDRVEDYRQQVAIVPCSAKTGEGIPELLMVITGLAQKFLEEQLHINKDAAAQGTVLEVKKEKGLGITLDVILYDGTLKVNDEIVVGALDGAITTKVKALFEPQPLGEMRDRKTMFKAVPLVVAASGVKVSAQGIDNVVAGMPLVAVAEDTVAQVTENIEKDIASVTLDEDKDGIILKADALGSLEALLFLLKEKNIPVRKALVGNITRKDILDARSTAVKQPLLAAVLGFNVIVDADAKADVGRKDIALFTSPIIYSLVEQFDAWQKEQKALSQKQGAASLAPLCKIKLLKEYVFRQSNPAVIGAEVLVGELVAGVSLMKNGNLLTKVKSIQLEKETVAKAEKEKQVAVSLEQVTLGRQLQGDEELYSFLTEHEYKAYKEAKEFLTTEQIELLKEIASIMRKQESAWGV